jgi:hypothetical protein
MFERRIAKSVKRPDMVEIIQLALEVVKKWSSDDPIVSDLNLTGREFNDCEVGLKSIERSEAKEDSLNVFMTDGTSYQISVKRTDNNFR